MIRPFTTTDMDQVITIWLEASIAAHDFVPADFWESKADDMREIYLPASETYVHEEANTITGFISLHNDTLAAIFVTPTAQGKGIGKQLMATAKQQRPHLTLTVYKANANAIEFYKKQAFTIQQEQLDPHTNHPELVMQYTA